MLSSNNLIMILLKMECIITINYYYKIGDNIETIKIKTNSQEWPDKKMIIYLEEILMTSINIKKG